MKRMIAYRLRIPALLYAIVCVALWPFPLLGLVHVESAAVVAGVSFFVAGLSGISLFRDRYGLHQVLAGHLVLVLVPWILLTATLLWKPNCAFWTGSGLFAVFVLPSAILGVALAFCLSQRVVRWKRTIFVLIGGSVCVVGSIVDLKFFPQLYTYNHVFGGVLGPIYDEELSIRAGLFWFRGLTLLWSLWLILLGTWLTRRKEGDVIIRRRLTLAGVVASVSIGVIYFFGPRLGIITTYQQIESVLTETVQTDGFVIHYQPGSLTEEELEYIVDEHGYRYARLSEVLNLEVDEPIHTYLYPDTKTRGSLIGSRTTSVTPVWLNRPQVHMLAEMFNASTFGHELVHVFSREFGMPFIHATTAIGLVEGLAVALEPPDGLPSSSEQVAATRQLSSDSLGRLQEGLAPALVASMSPFGFWSGRGAVSYAVSGSFVEYLLDNYGAEACKSAYRAADFEYAFGERLGNLAAFWEQALSEIEPSESAIEWAKWRFKQPSLFERKCPHHIPAVVRLTREAHELEERNQAGPTDARVSYDTYRRAGSLDSSYAPALLGWATRGYINGFESSDYVVSVLEQHVFGENGFVDPDQPVTLVIRLADFYRMQGLDTRADTLYKIAHERVPAYQGHTRWLLKLRSELGEEALRDLLSFGSGLQRAELIEGHAADNSAAHVFASVLRSQNGVYGEALRSLEAYASQVSDDSVNDRFALHLFQAVLADRAGEYPLVIVSAREAASLAPESQIPGIHRLMHDLESKAQWFLSRSE